MYMLVPMPCNAVTAKKMELNINQVKIMLTMKLIQ